MTITDISKWFSGLDAMTTLVCGVALALGIIGVIYGMRKILASEDGHDRSTRHDH